MFFGGMSHRLIDISLGCFLMGVGAWEWWLVGPAATNKDMTGDSKADDHLRVKPNARNWFLCLWSSVFSRRTFRVSMAMVDFGLTIPPATNPAITTGCHAEAELRRLVDRNRW